VINSADTAWMLTATALVLLMTLPALALFYGGLVQAKNILSVLVQCTAVAALCSVLWFAVGYSLTYSRPARVPRHAMVLREAAVCVTTWGSGFRLGSTMEFSGYDEGLNRIRLDALRRAAADSLHEPVGPELQEEWWGWRPMSMDEIPIIGPSTRWSNLSLATAHGMLGISMSAATGELIAAQLTGAATAIDATPYAPARFGL